MTAAGAGWLVLAPNEKPNRYPRVEQRRQARREEVRRLRAEGLTIGQIALALRISTNTVQGDLHALRAEPQPVRPPRLRVVRERSTAVASAGTAPLRPAVAYTPARGWHVTESPPGWFLDALSELD